MDKSKEKTPRKDLVKKYLTFLWEMNKPMKDSLFPKGPKLLYILQNFWDNTQYLPWQIFLANFFAKYSSNPFQLLKAMK